MKKDVDMIETLLDKNEYFYRKGKILKREYLNNNFFLIEKMENMLKDNERKFISSFLDDEFSVTKFNLSIKILKAVTN